jgi:hypothetical protein
MDCNLSPAQFVWLVSLRNALFFRNIGP